MAEDQGRPYQRKLKRHEISATINVRDRISDSFIGRLVNIHAEGLMIVGDTALIDGKLYQLKLELPQDVNRRNSIELGVDCLWVRSDSDDRMHWAGCKIIDVSDQGLADIGALVEVMGCDL